MKELKIGLRVLEGGLSFFGLEEVNTAISQGRRVVEIKEGSALMRKTNEDGQDVNLKLSGFSITVVMED